MCVSLYELMSRKKDILPRHLPYFESLPGVVRGQIIQRYPDVPRDCGGCGRRTPHGGTQVQAYFERVKGQLLASGPELQGGDDFVEFTHLPTLASARCQTLVDLIDLCKYFWGTFGPIASDLFDLI